MGPYSCRTTATFAARVRGLYDPIDLSSMVIVPDLAFNAPHISPISVLLPAPFGPMIARNVPAVTLKPTFLRTKLSGR